MFERIDHVAFTVKDRNTSIRFYEEHFGFQAYFEHDIPDPRMEKIVYLKLGDTVLELMHNPKGESNSGYHFCLISNDFAGDYDRLVAAGVEVLQPPHSPAPRTSSEEGWQRVVFRGPDDEKIEIRG
ncbi:MAG: VOC family protein [Gorillibacterium sp.]|nr:VOC family protein [Gorillibacterium sp.]